MKISLINMSFRNYSREYVQSLGIAYLASFLKKNNFNRVSIYDFFDERLNDNKHINIILNKTDMACFSLNNNNFNDSIKLIKKAKSRGIVTIVGGSLPTIDPLNVMKFCPQIDILVKGEGELTLLEVVKNLENYKSLNNIKGILYRDNNNKIVENKDRNLIKNLDSLPFPDRTPIKIYFRKSNKYNNWKKDSISVLRKSNIIPILSSKGCPYKCSFCCMTVKPQIWRRRSAKNLVDELELLKQEFGEYYIFFADDNFFVSKKHAISIIKEMKKRKINLKFKFETRTDNLVKGRSCLSFFKKNGCDRIELGLESGCQSILNRLNKGTKVQDNIKAINILDKLKLNNSVDFIFWDPYLTSIELKKNSEFLKKINGFHYINFKNKLKVYSNTNVYKKLKKEGNLYGKYPNLEYNFKNKKIEEIYEKFMFFSKYNHSLIRYFYYKRFDNQSFLKSKFKKKNSQIELAKEFKKIKFIEILNNFFEDLFINQKKVSYSEINKITNQLKKFNAFFKEYNLLNRKIYK